MNTQYFFMMKTHRRYYLHKQLKQWYSVHARSKTVQIPYGEKPDPRAQKYLQELANLGYNLQWFIFYNKNIIVTI